MESVHVQDLNYMKDLDTLYAAQLTSLVWRLFKLDIFAWRLALTRNDLGLPTFASG